MAEQKYSSFAIASFALGVSLYTIVPVILLFLLALFVYLLGNIGKILIIIILFSIVISPIILGIISIRKIKITQEKGRGLAIAGIILAIIYCFFIVFAIIAGAAFKNFL